MLICMHTHYSYVHVGYKNHKSRDRYVSKKAGVLISLFVRANAEAENLGGQGGLSPPKIGGCQWVKCIKYYVIANRLCRM